MSLNAEDEKLVRKIAEEALEMALIVADTEHKCCTSTYQEGPFKVRIDLEYKPKEGN